MGERVSIMRKIIITILCIAMILPYIGVSEVYGVERTLKGQVETYYIQEGEQVEVKVILDYVNGRQEVVDKQLNVKVEDEKIASFKDGMITGISEGNTTVTISTIGQKTTVDIQVYKSLDEADSQHTHNR